jgi:hypothetical protein
MQCVSQEEEDKTEYVVVDSSPKGYCHQRIHVSRELIEKSMKKEEEPKMETCTCKFDGHGLQVNPKCPLHGQVCSGMGLTRIENEQVIPIDSMKEGVPPIELKIHGSADPKLKVAIENAVKKAMERVSRCTCTPVSEIEDKLDPNCPIHGETKES